MNLHIVILAAGKGTRMVSDKQKVLHPVGGKAMLLQVVDTAMQLNPAQIHVVIGNQADEIKQKFSDLEVNWVLQTEQKGTGHAVQTALSHIDQSDALVLVLYGDVPLISVSTLTSTLSLAKDKESLALLVAKTPRPDGLGRIIRDGTNNIVRITEQRDATEEELRINEIYSGICATSKQLLEKWLPDLSDTNNQKEFYLTEIVSFAVRDKIAVKSHLAQDFIEIQGVNNRYELNMLERHWQRENAKRLMLEGVAIMDMERIDVRGELQCENDVTIDVNTVFEGNVTIGKNSIVGANCVLKDVTIGKNSTILPNSVIEGCNIADNCTVGPFARIRPGTSLASGSKIGNFVEAKNAKIDTNSKANHLTYLGDVIIGKNVNVGAGTITCNYDGKAKHQTIIEDNVFIGSGTELVAPVTVKKGATIGAGSTVRKDAPEDSLTLSVKEQRTVPNWKRK